ncbi:MAG: SUMF1/EgtB/PvdO family nonheme iron enzyme [Phycisphaerales bacterium]|nr:SUMF1/EgtB/PvdO family nonheme iron enzyme [Phycisphaerales bacterium]
MNGVIRAAAALVLGLASIAAAQGVPPSYGYEFVTVGAPGNPAFNDPTWPYSTVVNGRGRVDYAYRMSRTEVSTGQWMEFLNTFTFTTSPNPFWGHTPPAHWGARIDPLQGPGLGYTLRDVPSAAQLPVGGITWRMAAMYCNWLHNGKGSSVDSLLTGAYDASTWGDGPGGTFTDGWTHLPGAKYWIPTLDEQIKSQHYDPDRYGPGQGGWWLNKNKSDEPGIPGPPGVGTTSAGWGDPKHPGPEWDIPLGAYPDSQSPWGLLDTSGGTMEWNEFVFRSDHPEDRGHAGSYAGFLGFPLFDTIHGIGSTGPASPQPEVGLRIASIVPTPSSSIVFAIAVIAAARRRRP